MLDKLELFLNILRIESNAIELYYPNKMNIAPIDLGNADRIINSINIIFDNILLFLENNKQLIKIFNKQNYLN